MARANHMSLRKSALMRFSLVINNDNQIETLPLFLDLAGLFVCLELNCSAHMPLTKDQRFMQGQ
jgi:hypothetical protein